MLVLVMFWISSGKGYSRKNKQKGNQQIKQTNKKLAQQRKSSTTEKKTTYRMGEDIFK